MYREQSIAKQYSRELWNVSPSIYYHASDNKCNNYNLFLYNQEDLINSLQKLRRKKKNRENDEITEINQF